MRTPRQRRTPHDLWRPTLDVYVGCVGALCSIEPVSAWARTWCVTHCGAPDADGRYVVERHRATVLLRALYRAGATMQVG